jgi:predicted RNA-binding Zn-ribbon protein involved in translation (DUF1610 family)
MTENELRSAALDYGCPECGAVVGKRCRMENKTLRHGTQAPAW